MSLNNLQEKKIGQYLYHQLRMQWLKQLIFLFF
jgi:hypothetical protein